MLSVLSFERLEHWIFEVIARSEGSEELFEVQLGYGHFLLHVLGPRFGMQRTFSHLSLFIFAGCKCDLLSSGFNRVSFSKILTFLFNRFGLMSLGYFLALLSISHLSAGFCIFSDGSGGLLT